MKKPQPLEDLFKDRFREFQPKPSQGLWSAIESKLWLSNFFKFGLTSINVYYTAAILATFVAATATFWPNSSAENETLLPATQTDVLSSQSQAIQTLPAAETRLSNQSQTLEKNINPSQSITPLTSTSISTSIPIAENPSIAESQHRPEDQNNKPDLQQTIEDISLKSEIQIHKSEPQIANEYLDLSIVKSESPAEIEHLDLTIVKSEPQAEIGQNDLPKVELELNDSENISNVAVADQSLLLPSETEEISSLEPAVQAVAPAPDKNRYSPWSFDLSTKALAYGVTYQSEDQELESALNLANLKNRAFDLEWNVNYTYGSWLLQSGLAYTKIQEDFRHNQVQINDSLIEYWDVFSAGTQTISDTMYWTFQFDSALSTYFYVPITSDSTFELMDSSFVSYTVSKEILTLYQNLNQYSYFEIPFSISRNFYSHPIGSSGKRLIHFGLRAGTRFSFFLNAKGKTILRNPEIDVFSLNQTQLPYLFSRIHVDLGAPVLYEINPRFSLLVEPNYRFSIQSAFGENQTVQVQQKGPGLKIGLRYHFVKII